MIQFLDDIEQHFSRCYPREGCGVLAVIRGDLNWFPCTNIAEDGKDFIIDSTEYMKIAQQGDIVGIVHSHPDESCKPRELDIRYCNA